MKFRPTHKKGEMVVELGSGEKPTQLSVSEPLTPAFSLKRILVPVDFSDCSKKALTYAIAFAQQFRAELTLLHVIEPYPPIPQMDPLDMESVQDAKGKLEVLKSAIGDRVASKAVLRTGDPQTEIINLANELGIDLIILSTHGRSRLARVFLGSTAEKVTRHAACPILIVREREHDFIQNGAREC